MLVQRLMYKVVMVMACIDRAVKSEDISLAVTAEFRFLSTNRIKESAICPMRQLSLNERAPAVNLSSE